MMTGNHYTQFVLALVLLYVNLSWFQGRMTEWDLFVLHCITCVAVGLAYVTSANTNIKEIPITLVVPLYIGIISF